MKEQFNFISETSQIYKTIYKSTQEAKIIVFSGLPGVGKSLYINQCLAIAAKEGFKVSCIQWDIARKAFETEKISKRFPIKAGEVHGGVKLACGAWLMDIVKNWFAKNRLDRSILLIEAPLVGHRFIELVQVQEDSFIEEIFKDEKVHFLCPIPSKKVREKIELDRANQVKQDAKDWMGAKPAVMLKLWKEVCGIANEFGLHISTNDQPPYDPKVYEYVFKNILKHRFFIPLYINEIFSVDIENEKDLHSVGSLKASKNEAETKFTIVMQKYPTEEAINSVVEKWYIQ